VLFGSDAPFGPKKTNGWLGLITEMLDSLDIGQTDRDAIYGGNAKRLLNL
jgi:predicted TIM-barrel fold metal-dependent hydrolase